MMLKWKYRRSKKVTLNELSKDIGHIIFWQRKCVKALAHWYQTTAVSTGAQRLGGPSTSSCCYHYQTLHSKLLRKEYTKRKGTLQINHLVSIFLNEHWHLQWSATNCTPKDWLYHPTSSASILKDRPQEISVFSPFQTSVPTWTTRFTPSTYAMHLLVLAKHIPHVGMFLALHCRIHVEKTKDR